MAKPLINPRVNRLYRNYTERLIATFGARAKFVVVTVTTSDCPNCGLDSQTGTGNGKYNGTGPTPFDGRVCPVCDNKFHIPQEVPRRIEANVRYGKAVDTNFAKQSSGGSLPEGSAQVKTYLKYQALLKNATYYLLDDVRYKKLTEPVPGGLQDYVRVTMILQRDE